MQEMQGASCYWVQRGSKAVTDTIDAIKNEHLENVYHEFVSLYEVTFINKPDEF